MSLYLDGYDRLEADKVSLGRNEKFWLDYWEKDTVNYFDLEVS